MFKKLLPTALMASLACGAAFGSNNIPLTDEQAPVANALAVAARQQALATKKGVSLAFVEAVEEMDATLLGIEKPRLRALGMVNNRRGFPDLPKLVLEELAQYLANPIVDWTNPESIQSAFQPFQSAEEQIAQSRFISLGLENQRLSVLPTLTSLTQLELLDLSFNQLTALPEGLSQLTNLESLDLSDNQLTSLPEGLSKLTNLWELRLDHNKLTVLSEWMSALRGLEVLSLQYNSLSVLPEGFSALTRLTGLHLMDNPLRALPEWFSKLTNLEFLDLNGNQLTALPAGFSGLTRLQFLYLDQALISQLSPAHQAIAN